MLDYIKFKSSKKINVIKKEKNLRVYDEKYISGNNGKLKKNWWKPKKNYKDILDEICKFE